MRQLLIWTVVMFLSVNVMARGGNGRGYHQGQGRGNGDCLSNIPVGVVTSNQKQELIYMWQEEKLARDVYLEMADLYPNMRVFKNISRAEQKHMDAIKRLLVRYELDIPVVSEERGEFKLVALKELYTALVQRGNQSLKSAIKVGLDIELLDIKDLEEKTVGMPEDVKKVFTNLLNASYRHKEAFARQLDLQ